MFQKAKVRCVANRFYNSIVLTQEEDKKVILKAGLNDSISYFQEDNNLIVFSINRSLGYIGIQVIETKSFIEIENLYLFLQSESDFEALRENMFINLLETYSNNLDKFIDWLFNQEDQYIYIYIYIYIYSKNVI